MSHVRDAVTRRVSLWDEDNPFGKFRKQLNVRLYGPHALLADQVAEKMRMNSSACARFLMEKALQDAADVLGLPFPGDFSEDEAEEAHVQAHLADVPEE